MFFTNFFDPIHGFFCPLLLTNNLHRRGKVDYECDTIDSSCGVINCSFLITTQLRTVAHHGAEQVADAAAAHLDLDQHHLRLQLLLL